MVSYAAYRPWNNYNRLQIVVSIYETKLLKKLNLYWFIKIKLISIIFIIYINYFEIDTNTRGHPLQASCANSSPIRPDWEFLVIIIIFAINVGEVAALFNVDKFYLFNF